jgi:hypothetical protein
MTPQLKSAGPMTIFWFSGTHKANGSILCINGRTVISGGLNPKLEIVKPDESCIANPKSEISNWTVQFAISDVGRGAQARQREAVIFRMQDSSDFKLPFRPALNSPL